MMCLNHSKMSVYESLQEGECFLSTVKWKFRIRFLFPWMAIENRTIASGCFASFTKYEDHRPSDFSFFRWSFFGTQTQTHRHKTLYGSNSICSIRLLKDQHLMKMEAKINSFVQCSISNRIENKWNYSWTHQREEKQVIICIHTGKPY